MTLLELREEISIELEMRGNTGQAAVLLLSDLTGREPTVRKKTAAAAFLAQFYGGIENILKRFHRYHGVPMPTGDSWHTDIFNRFCNPPFQPFPVLFDDSLATDLSPFRKFRHVVYHGSRVYQSGCASSALMFDFEISKLNQLRSRLNCSNSKKSAS